MKPALGRNLGTLLGGPVAKPVADPLDAQSQLPLQQPGPGVRSLLRGQHPESSIPEEIEPQACNQTAPTPSHTLIPRWYFFAADVLLVALAIVFIYQCPPGAKWVLRLISMALVLLGCCLGLFGAWLGMDEKKD